MVTKFRKVTGLVLVLVIGMCFQSYGQEVSGTVTDAQTLEPLPGVNILVKGTSTGASTDADGEFEFSVSSLQDTLIVSYIGYQTKEVPINGQTEFDIVLQAQAITGEELVVIGYGTQERENLTASVSEIEGQELAERPNANLLNSLQGKLPGLNITKQTGNPANKPEINIRGYTSINGGSPLVLIDGVEGDINDINPQNVESMTVLKDAGAAAIYGGRAAFGVVLVTTKTPSSGDIQVNYNNNISFLTPTSNTDFVSDGYQAIQIADQAMIASTGSSYSRYSEEDYEELRRRSNDPSLPKVVVQNINGTDQYMHYGSTDWWNTIFQNRRLMQTHDLSISGGSDRLRGSLSGRFYNQEGMIKAQNSDGYTSYNIRGKLDFKMYDWLSLSEDLRVVQTDRRRFGGGNAGYLNTFHRYLWYHTTPWQVPTNPDGSFTFRPSKGSGSIGGGLPASLRYGKTFQDNTVNELQNTFEVVLNPIQDLTVTANYTNRWNINTQSRRNTQVPWSNTPGEINYLGRDQLLEVRENDSYQAFNLYANYATQFGKHQIKGVLGLNQEHAKYGSISASKRNNISVNLNALDLASSDPQAYGSAREWALLGYFSRLNYNFDDRYLLEVNGRYDGTSRFPEDSRWGFFPSVSAGWIVSNEAFFDGLKDEISQLKLRASYGSLGNQQVATYAYTPTLSKSTSNYIVDGTSLEYVNSPGVNPRNITWEKVNTINLGADISFFNGQFSINTDIFQRRTNGMLTSGESLPAVLGTGSPQENAANLRTRGFELKVSYQNTFQLVDSPFNFSFTGALSNQKTIITKFDNPNNFLGDYYEGQTLGEMWGYHVDGLFASDEEAANHIDQSRVNASIMASPGEYGQPLAGDLKYVDLNGDGVIDNGDNTLENPGDRRIIGDAAPQFPYSFTMETNWKNVDFSIFFQGVAQQDWYPRQNSLAFWGPYARGYASFVRKDLANDIWSTENKDAYYPRLRSFVANSAGDELTTVNDRYMQNVAYLRLKNITIGYTLPSRWTQQLNVRGIRIFASGENLLTFSSLTDYIDPEAASNSFNFANPTANYSSAGARSNAQGYPFSKIYSLGINIDI